jgi:hypothetical protein
MRNPVLKTGERITIRGRCSDLRLFVIEREFTVIGGGGFRYAALSGGTKIGTFAYFKDSPSAIAAMVAHLREFKPKAVIHLSIAAD